MKNRIQIVAALLVATILSAAASGELQRSLNGTWQFTTNAAAAPWTSDAKDKPGTTVKLFTPTGYDVAESE